MQLLRAANRIARPWQNGGGITYDVAASPVTAPLDQIAWRVSIAEIAAPGPFSRFEGLDRILTVLEGTLQLPGRTLVAGNSIAFPGEDAVHAIPLDGPVQALNVMTRRGEWHAAVDRWSPNLPSADIRIAIAGDAMILDAGESPPPDFSGHVIRIDPA
jgi:environmental stress-induced protein Ves